MLDFICMVFAELLSTGYKRKIQNDKVCLRRESNQRPLSTGNVKELCNIGKFIKFAFKERKTM